jgi:hypothetical protein
MARFPISRRPAPRPEYRGLNDEPEKMLSYEDLIKTASFSPELSFLLAMLFKDGINQNRAADMFRDIGQFVSDGDKAAINSILGALQMSDEFRKSSPDISVPHVSNGLSEFSKISRQQLLLNSMLKYAGRDSGAMMRNLQRTYEMQDNYERMLKRLQKLNNINGNSPEEMFEALSIFMSPEQQANFQSMQNMMRMMGSMNNFKPEDILKFMGGSGK